MFTESASFYDAIYAFKDYDAEASKIAAAIRARTPAARTLLDVACGTGMHARRLAAQHGFDVDGVDRDPVMVQLARATHPAGRFVEADMTAFALGRRYDAVTCFFGSIGYLLTMDRVRVALACFRRHLMPGGVIVVEPFFQPGTLDPSRVFTNTGVHAGVSIERVGRVELENEGTRVRALFDYYIDRPDGREHRVEIHELGLFTVDEMRDAFLAEGLRPEYDAEGLIGRGLWIATVAGEGAS
jgi:ubiquinone/menaquinone biosynthesis C-methylase UbiE